MTDIESAYEYGFLTLEQYKWLMLGKKVEGVRFKCEKTPNLKAKTMTIKFTVVIEKTVGEEGN